MGIGMKRSTTIWAALAAGCLVSTGAASAAGEAPASAASRHAVFALVNGTAITTQQYEAAFNAAVRKKFYHRQPPENQLAAFRREVADALINRVLLVAEGARRGIKPDAARVSDTIAGYERRYQDSPQWRKNREALLPELRRELEQLSVLERLEQAVRTAPEPGEEHVRSYYAAHPDLFTEPERVRLSVILLKVDPSAPGIAWNKAREEAQAIVRRLAAGTDFAALARLHSGDATAGKGGDMGYVHRGMLPRAVHEVLDKLKPGMISEPVTVLEGVAIFRLVERRASRLRTYAEVRKRAADLWKREQADANWNGLIATLRSAAAITIDQARFPEFSATGSGTRVQTGR